jgi:hypothetical protein
LAVHRKLLGHLAAKHRLPATSIFSHYTEAGLLMSYGPSIDDLFRQAATYVDKILKREARGSTGAAACAIRDDCQPEDREDDWTHDPAIADVAGGSRRRMTRRVSNSALERTAGSPSLAAAAHRHR